MSCEGDRAVLNSIFNPLLPIGECVFDENIPSDLKDDVDVSPQNKAACTEEVKGVKAAEAGNVEEAIAAFTKSINMAPNRASGYNNRAQALRLQGKKNDALEDLHKAIAVSKGKGRTACQSFTQRAMIRRLEGNDEEAKTDFESAAKLGSEFAKVQVVQMNPYAALCNKMLHDIFTKMQEVPEGKC